MENKNNKILDIFYRKIKYNRYFNVIEFIEKNNITKKMIENDINFYKRINNQELLNFSLSEYIKNNTKITVGLYNIEDKKIKDFTFTETNKKIYNNFPLLLALEYNSYSLVEYFFEKLLLDKNDLIENNKICLYYSLYNNKEKSLRFFLRKIFNNNLNSFIEIFDIDIFYHISKNNYIYLLSDISKLKYGKKTILNFFKKNLYYLNDNLEVFNSLFIADYVFNNCSDNFYYKKIYYKGALSLYLSLNAKIDKNSIIQFIESKSLHTLKKNEKNDNNKEENEGIIIL